MNNMKKLASILLALVMVFTMATTAFAVSITINGGATGSEYAAYKLLNAEVVPGSDPVEYIYSVNADFRAVLKTATGLGDAATDDDILRYIGAIADNSTDARTFADTVYAAIKANSIAPTKTTTDEANKNIFTNADQGYYLIEEIKLGEDATDTYSLVMLDTAGNDGVTITTKEDVPTLDKDIVGATIDDAVTAQIGDIVEFVLTGTVSNKIGDYDEYYYAFSDTMTDGLTYGNDVKFYVLKDGVETEIVSGFNVTNVTDRGFKATCENLKDVDGVEAGVQILAKYTATINENAVVKNTNSATLEYANDPYDGDGFTTTPADTTTVYTFNVEVDKVDGSDKALAGAEFILKSDEGYYKWDDVNNVVTWVADEEDATVFTSNADGNVVNDALSLTGFKGLDVGTYTLIEKAAPQGYNKAADVEVEISATYTETALTTFTVSNTVATDSATGTGTVKVVNQFGSELPSTGGIGTTIFYVSGAVLAIAAVVFLVTKKRMNGAEEE